MIIDDRPYIPDPGELGNIIYVTAQKRGKNGNVKKRIALRIFGGTHTVEMIERLRREMVAALQSALQQSRSVRLWSMKENF